MYESYTVSTGLASRHMHGSVSSRLELTGYQTTGTQKSVSRHH